MTRDLNKLLRGAANGAALKEVVNASIEKGVRPKKLNNVPKNYFDIHQKLKESGRTTLNFEAYIMEALREKFKKDNAI